MRDSWIGLGTGVLLALSAACGSTPTTVTPSRAPRADASPAGAAAPVVDLRLESLEPKGRAARIGRVERNLFRFGPGAPDESEAQPTAPRVIFPVTPPRTGGIPPPSVAPIALRYIGLLDAPSQAGLVAILTDGRGNIFYGREGDTIEGRYLVVQVSTTATELSYLDGRGRQTVRLSGQ
jgi:hypothetical protein